MSVKSSIKAEFSEDLHDKERKKQIFESQLPEKYECWAERKSLISVHTCNANTNTGERLKCKRKGGKIRRLSRALSPKCGQRRPQSRFNFGCLHLSQVYIFVLIALVRKSDSQIVNVSALAFAFVFTIW